MLGCSVTTSRRTWHLSPVHRMIFCECMMCSPFDMIMTSSFAAFHSSTNESGCHGSRSERVHPASEACGRGSRDKVSLWSGSGSSAPGQRLHRLLWWKVGRQICASRPQTEFEGASFFAGCEIISPDTSADVGSLCTHWSMLSCFFFDLRGDLLVFPDHSLHSPLPGSESDCWDHSQTFILFGDYEPLFHYMSSSL